MLYSICVGSNPTNGGAIAQSAVEPQSLRAVSCASCYQEIGPSAVLQYHPLPGPYVPSAGYSSSKWFMIKYTAEKVDIEKT